MAKQEVEFAVYIQDSDLSERKFGHVWAFTERLAMQKVRNMRLGVKVTGAVKIPKPWTPDSK